MKPLSIKQVSFVSARRYRAVIRNSEMCEETSKAFDYICQLGKDQVSAKVYLFGLPGHPCHLLSDSCIL